MKINQNRPDTQKVPVNTINTMLEQISDLQTDVAGLQNEVNGLEQSIDTVNIEATQAQIDSINATNIESTNATINNITASVKVDTANLDANIAEIDTATIGTETVGTSTITDATIATADITDLDAVTGTVQHLRTGNIEANSVDADTITTKGITNSGNYTGKNVTVKNVTASDTINAKNLNVSDSVSVADINITGSVTGLSDIEADSIIVDEIKADTAEIQSIKNHSIYTDTLHPLVPSPSLVSDSDRYTIELPTFDGTMVLTWKEGNAVRWTATVIGNGVDYGITFGCTEDQVYINELFQWNKKLYIRHSANGQLLYSYSAEKELEPITIYYNMGAWTNPKSLEELTEEDYYYQVVRASGTVWFGKTIIPRLDDGDENNGTFNFKGSRKLNELPTLSESDVGDVWNITEETYTDDRFVEGAGKPINAGDDVVAVEVEEDGGDLEPLDSDFFGDKYVSNISDTKTPDGDFLISALEDGLYPTATTLYKGKNSVWTPILTDCGAAIVTHTGRIIVERYFDWPTISYSDDNGITWTDTESEYRAEYGFGYFHEFNNRIWYITAYLSTYYSDDNGITWTEINEVLSPNIVQGEENSLLALSSNDNHATIIKSVDNGDTWVTIYTSEGNYNSIKSIAAIDNYIFRSESNKVYRSNDEGTTWEEVFDGRLNAFLVVIDNKLLIPAMDKIYISSDYGTNIEPLVDIDNPKYIVKDYGDYIITADTGSQLLDNIYFLSTSTRKLLKWNKFAAGVNYENFVAENITATESLKSEGTLEVDGTSQFDGNVNVDANVTADKVITPDLEVTNTLTANSTGVDVTKNITHTGNYTATGNQTITGNLNRTGNETITGVVVIGDLD